MILIEVKGFGIPNSLDQYLYSVKCHSSRFF